MSSLQSRRDFFERALTFVQPPYWIFHAGEDWREKESFTKGVSDRKEKE